ncbi:carboxypeptidase-like regulatory domain-containing protein [Flavobacterium hauense]
MKQLITILLLLLNSFIVLAQEKPNIGSKKITGVITDSEGMPIPGATITISGTSKNVQADFDGIYTIEAKEGEKLVASHIGMANETIAISKQTTIDFKLLEATLVTKPIHAPDTHAVKSVTAFWEEKKLSEKFIMYKEKPLPVTNGCIGGQSEGTVIRCYGSINGSPQPLYVIDGFPLNADNFKAINPDDIISINVLKDSGATSIYGNRGMDGVIIVKTKNGLTKKEKRKLRREAKNQEKKKIN